MLIRMALPLFIFLTTGGQALACSCALWGSGNISKYAENYVTVWVVPTKGEVKNAQSEWPSLPVFYELVVLEGFGQIPSGKLTAISSVDDGASCGVQLTLGNPQLVSLSKSEDVPFGLSACAPEMPYRALKTYLKTGKDVVVPNKYYCLKEEKKTKAEEKMCEVWNAEPKYQTRFGEEDWSKYLQQWHAQTKTELPPKKNPWWKFWK